MTCMGTLKQQLRDDLTAAMKARDRVRSSTLRMVLTSVTNAEVAGKEAIELSDEQVRAVVSSEAKKRREAAAAFANAGRTEASATEKAELDVILAYLPEQMDEATIAAVVSAVIDELDVRGVGPRAMGRVMGALQPKVKGRADGAVVAAQVKAQLG